LEQQTWMGWVFAGVGAFSIAGAVKDWDWFMLSRRSRWMVSLFGRKAARAVYGVLGVGILVTGVLVALGIVGGPPAAS
jgi:hypothetical protein